jgi:ATP-dependent Clp endopeptidase proteolytic subunit ClpP
MSRKRRRVTQEEEEELEPPKFSLDLPELPLSFGSFNDTKVENNHIYFYEDVSHKSALNLNMKLRDLEQKLLDKNHKHSLHQEYIYLHICSMGGCVFSAFSIIDTIKNLKVPVVSIIEGNAASAATMISVVCDYKLCHPNSYMLIHELSSGAWGKFSEIEIEVNNLKKLMRRIKSIYKKHTNLSEEDLNNMLSDDVWWTSKESLNMRLVDEIINCSKKYKFDRNNLFM